MSVSPSTATALPANVDIIREAFRMSDTARFFHLLRQASSLIRLHGPYTTFSGTTAFSPAPVPPPRTTTASVKDVAVSLAAAQDSIDTAQPEGPAKEDLVLFKHLWETTITILEKLLDGGELDQESFGWGIYGLASGYMQPPANNVATCNLFSLHKHRLYVALASLPSMDSFARQRNKYVVSEKTNIQSLVKARREVHICGNLLLQQFRQESWRCVRWWHAIAIAERWTELLGRMPADLHLRKERTLSGMKPDEQTVA
ncbi:uncharacterized protein K460DRAFT_102550 [Cucurbitaria berberidis CBS 394.84]|uniref:Uncharacterized protein n=1 Tax=Cucurbitaria berberidis CBS 394.84 TaxID=1168544 RepID=A0A9P4L8A7_9PLEO|nr:uncharacterized protein K460DRAFT_102550 [Cucurbitaria berberidis CBS 394.84]KAF1845063.1 hypothetical protein K460DRAFT_102550 [Cucurbitaria berberidis CBS 394.84]